MLKRSHPLKRNPYRSLVSDRSVFCVRFLLPVCPCRGECGRGRVGEVLDVTIRLFLLLARQLRKQTNSNQWLCRSSVAIWQWRAHTAKHKNVQMFICIELRPSQLSSQSSTLLFPGITEVSSSAAIALHICACAWNSCYMFTEAAAATFTHMHHTEDDVYQKPLQQCIPVVAKLVNNL